MSRIYEYNIITACEEATMAEKVTQALNMNPDCQPYGGLCVSDDREGRTWFHQAIVYKQHIETYAMPIE